MKETLSAFKPLITRWLQDHGLPLDRPFRCLNPAHTDHHPSMRYNPRNHTVHCFACGATYDLFDLVGREEGCAGFAAQLAAVRKRYGSVQPVRSAPAVRTAVRVFSYRPGQGRPHPYFAARGLSEETVRRYGLVVEDGWAVLPLFAGGVCKGVCRRALDPQAKPRYRNSRGRLGLWNGDALAGAGTVFVTEGIFDALSLAELGLRGVALCGAANTAKLVQAWEALEPDRRPLVVTAGDGDEAGRKMNDTLCRELESRGGRCLPLALPEGCHDVNEALCRDRDALAAVCRRAAEGSGIPRDDTAAALLAYIGRRRASPPRSTGLAALDRCLGGGLFPGLTVLGAVSGMGKTTLMLQIADTLAAAGQPVLFFTVEMSRFELLAKSLVRDGGAGESARALLDGQLSDERVAALAAAYEARTGGRVTLEEPDGPLTPDGLTQRVEAYLDRHGGAVPVVFLDYLQLLAPQRAGATDKQNADRAVAALKQIARRYQTPVFASSSFNREAYHTGAEMNAFKESGLVEYSADLLLALQYRGMGEKGFSARAESARPVRRLELVVLKNRFGRAGERLALDYRPAAERFAPPEEPPAPARPKRVLR